MQASDFSYSFYPPTPGHQRSKSRGPTAVRFSGVPAGHKLLLFSLRACTCLHGSASDHGTGNILGRVGSGLSEPHRRRHGMAQCRRTHSSGGVSFFSIPLATVETGRKGRIGGKWSVRRRFRQLPPSPAAEVPGSYLQFLFSLGASVSIGRNSFSYVPVSV